MGQTWPKTAAALQQRVSQVREMAGSVATKGSSSPGTTPAPITPLPTSMTTTPSANRKPCVRSAFVPPALPLPIVLMSTPPRSRPTISAPINEPMK